MTGLNLKAEGKRIVKCLDLLFEQPKLLKS